jgi:mannose-1-phosphate guanylyltransferase
MSVGVVVLCAGLGTRLRPLTTRIPKPALPILDAPLVRRHFRLAKAIRADDLAVNTHHLPDVMRAGARSEAAALGLPLRISHEAEIQGTGGGIRDAMAGRRHHTLVVLNGDTLFDLDLAAAVRAHRSSGASATLVLAPMPRNETYASVECDRVMRVKRIAGLGENGGHFTPWHFTGVHILTAAAFFEFASKTGPVDINRGVYPEMIEAGRTIAGHIDRGYWNDVGTPERLFAVHRDFLSGRIPDACAGGIKPGVHKSAHVHEAATVSRRTYVGPAADVREGAVLGPGVFVGAGAVVGVGAKLTNAVVLQDTVVSSGERLQDLIAADGARLKIKQRSSERART